MNRSITDQLVIEAAKLIIKYCGNTPRCADCIFYEDHGKYSVCKLRDNGNPAGWEVDDDEL